MRFAVARQEGLTEELVGEITDDYADSALPDRHKAALAFADAFLDAAGPPSAAVQEMIAASLSPAELACFPLIEAEWPSTDAEAPNWQRWETVARARHKSVPKLAGLINLSFREELHAIEAAIAGQGVAICSNVLV